MAYGINEEPSKPVGYICSYCKTIYTFILDTVITDMKQIPHLDSDYCEVCGGHWPIVFDEEKLDLDKLITADGCIGAYGNIGDEGPNWFAEEEIVPRIEIVEINGNCKDCIRVCAQRDKPDAICKPLIGKHTPALEVDQNFLVLKMEEKK